MNRFPLQFLLSSKRAIHLRETKHIIPHHQVNCFALIKWSWLPFPRNWRTNLTLYTGSTRTTNIVLSFKGFSGQGMMMVCVCGYLAVTKSVLLDTISIPLYWWHWNNICYNLISVINITYTPSCIPHIIQLSMYITILEQFENIIMVCLINCLFLIINIALDFLCTSLSKNNLKYHHRLSE